jgi:hypothetical protein
MRCFFHESTDAAATCRDCGCGLCAACGRRFTLMLCAPCLKRRNKNVARRHSTDLALTAVAYVAGLSFYLFALPGRERPPVTIAVAAALGFPFVFWGWRFLSQHTPRGWIALPVGWWVILWGLKAMLSLFVGVLVAPVRVFQSARELIRIRRASAHIDATSASPTPAIPMRPLAKAPSGPHASR